MKTNINELFRIDTSSIEESFTRISKELFNNYYIKINDSIFLFTEIEFYYFYKGIHEDENTHEHDLPSGRWRCHSQGLDITFESILPDISDGGILIRGIKQVEPFSDKPYVNGSRRVLFRIFNSLNDVMTLNSGLNLIKTQSPLNHEIYRTSRQGIKQPTYIDSKYRYFTELEYWNWKELGSTYRQNIEKYMEHVL
jgi:hypothetical protein